MTAAGGGDATFVLVHSPLVGPFTWSAVAEVLRERGHDVSVPALSGTAAPFWRAHAESVAAALRGPTHRPLVLVAHSGAGALLPAIGAAIPERPKAAYVFVDAVLPLDGATRLQGLEEEDAEFAAELRAELEAGGRFPTWTAEDLEAVVPDPGSRRALLAELAPRALDYFSEAIPPVPGWPDAPCAYLQFSAPYDVAARRARDRDWRYEHLDAGHFHMLVDPPAVADAVLRLAGGGEGSPF
ncbi:MAG: alpha/beta hydrolase [Euzebyaceae bacterium]|nr:alpha/beta hydrolase [Euzebyaceae bacterium]